MYPNIQRKDIAIFKEKSNNTYFVEHFSLSSKTSNMKKILTLILISSFSFSSIAQNIELVEYATGFSSPVELVHAGDDRLFVVERRGIIKILDAAANTLATPFLDIDNLIPNISGQSERGLLGLAFHPNYANNGLFYVNYTNTDDNTVVAQYSRDAADPNLADVNSAIVLMTVTQPASNHNGGCLRFGPDGYLYIGMGDGGSGNDPWNNSQDTQELLGKMLRIDVNNENSLIPPTNPFVGDPNVLDEIWAIGVRNPWKFSFDRETGDLWIADVGQNAWEEIDFQPANSTGGENYGWRCYEGNHLNNNVTTTNCPPQSDLVNPVYEIPHQGFTGPCSITGGYVYRGTENPDLIGKYICADFCSGEFFTVEPDGVGGWVGQEVADPNYDISTFGEDFNGELYVARLSNGRIYKVKSDACASLMLSANVTSEPCEGELNGTADVTAAGGTPPYMYSPNLDFNNLPADNYTVSITDDSGCGTSVSFTINSLPLPATPTINVNDNDLSTLSGLASYQWFLNGQAITGANSVNYTIGESGNYSVEITDANGCSNTSTETSVIFTGLDAIPALDAVNITPNPFVKNLYVEIIVKEQIDLEIEILDLNGKNLYSKKISVNDKLTQEINLDRLSTGVYYLNLISDNRIVSKKIVKN